MSVRWLAAAALLAAGCARTAVPPRLEPLGGLDAAFTAARGHRRLLALVSPN